MDILHKFKTKEFDMKTLKFWQVDAFTNQAFKGNPAAIFVIEEQLEDSLMQNIAAEMNLSETAFVQLRAGHKPLLRWFTPIMEVDLCGHATLASAHVLFNEIHPEWSSVTFDTKFVGPLNVKKNERGSTLDFPSRPGKTLSLEQVPSFVVKALGGVKPVFAVDSRDLMLVYDSDEEVKKMAPDFNGLIGYDRAIIVTARSRDLRYDFISRLFSVYDGIPEDPVTGSAHCTLTPYWSKQLGKTKLNAFQASKRGGELLVEMQGNQVLITGESVTIMEGVLSL